ncbi:sensor domain-containing diguanylate cyclase [Halanaerobaculum tunisiense]
MKLDIFSQILMKDLDYKRKVYLSWILLIISMGLLYIFTVDQLPIYTLGIILSGRLFGFPYGSLVGIVLFLLGRPLVDLHWVVIIIGGISDLYHAPLLNRLKLRLKDIVVSLLLTCGYLLYIRNYKLLLYYICFYVVLTIVSNFKLQLKSFQRQKREFKNACQARDSLEQLHSINEKLISNFKVEEACEELVKIGCQQLNAKYGGGLLYNKTKEKFELKCKQGLDKKYITKLQLAKSASFVADLEKEDILVIDNLKKYCYYNCSIFLEDGFRSAVIAPVFKQQQIKGVLFFLAKKKNFFSDLNLTPLQTIIDQAPLVIEKAEIFEKMERNVAGLSMLQRTSNIINSTLKQEKVFEHTVDMIMGTMGVSMSGLFLVTEEELDLVAARGVPDQNRELIVTETKEVAWEVIESKEILINDQLENRSDKYSFELIDVKSVMFVPLNIRGRVIGVVAAAQIGFERKFKKADQRFVTTLANQIAVAIENASMYKKMEKLANEDGLTKLYNHSFFQERLGEELEKSSRHNRDLSLLMLDIDNFKDFNDLYGHQAGDKVLKEIAKLLKENVRIADVVARYGGEEFVIILPETDNQGAYEMGQRINQLVRNNIIKYNGLELTVTTSIGGATYQPNQSPKDLISQADQALYKAKSSGKDRIYIIGGRFVGEDRNN